MSELLPCPFCGGLRSGDAWNSRAKPSIPHVIDENHAYGDQEVYYGVLTEANFVEGEQSVIKLVACVSEDSAYLSDNHGDLRDLDEFDFVVGPFRRGELR